MPRPYQGATILEALHGLAYQLYRVKTKRSRNRAYITRNGAFLQKLNNAILGEVVYSRAVEAAGWLFLLIVNIDAKSTGDSLYQQGYLP